MSSSSLNPWESPARRAAAARAVPSVYSPYRRWSSAPSSDGTFILCDTSEHPKCRSNSRGAASSLKRPRGGVAFGPTRKGPRQKAESGTPETSLLRHKVPGPVSNDPLSMRKTALGTDRRPAHCFSVQDDDELGQLGMVTKLIFRPQPRQGPPRCWGPLPFQRPRQNAPP